MDDCQDFTEMFCSSMEAHDFNLNNVSWVKPRISERLILTEEFFFTCISLFLCWLI